MLSELYGNSIIRCLLYPRALEKEKEDLAALRNAYKDVCKQLKGKDESQTSVAQALKENARLTEALAESEAALKQAEEFLYISKVESSELIWLDRRPYMYECMYVCR